MSIKLKTLATATIPVILLAACSGSGGSNGGNNGTTERQFTTFDNLVRNGTTIVDGQAVTAEVSSTPTGVAQTSKNGPSDATTRIYQENGGLVALRVNGSGASARIDEREGGSFTIDGEYVRGTQGDNETLFGDPETLGYNHQTFGVWIDGDPSTSASYGTGSFGNRTGSRPSSTSTATYQGRSIGVYTNANGSDSGILKGNATVTTDFNTANFSTSNQRLDYFNGNASNILRNDLAVSGTLAVGNDGSMTGAVSGIATSGTASGSFYGGNAQEVGGTFSTSNGNGSMNVNGSFGAKR